MNPSIHDGKSMAPEAPGRPGRRSMGIALRIALMTWLVALATMIVFILITTPQQKKTFLRQLESKANSVTLSLHDDAAGAAINEDYASVISSAQTMIEGDSSLDFLMVMRNDGFSLVIERGGWRVAQEADPYWLDRKREPAGNIKHVPGFKRRVFHYAKPFDYSGIQWGWIHVGLSLEEYDNSVTTLYRHTAAILVGCIFVSLLLSIFIARRLVRPILSLRHVVEKIASGNLSVRADTLRHDEIGNLSDSVNTMVEALLRRDRILESVRFAAQQFLEKTKWEYIIDDVLEKLGRAACVSRAGLFENHLDADGRVCCGLRSQWMAPGITSNLLPEDLQRIDYAREGLGHWSEKLSKNEFISGPVSGLGFDEQTILEIQEVLSIMVVPIFVDGKWWGFLSLDDCTRPRIWSDAEKDSLRAAANMIGATIARQQIQEALMESKATLERRVAERTRELQTQVTAKERALEELAAAQSSLLEVSRAAGMAEVATGVLHNVGNVLNSVNVSCTLLLEQIRESRVGNLARVADMLLQPEGGLAYFITEDPRGRQIPQYLSGLAASLKGEYRLMQRETSELQDRIQHIKEIVTMQQSYGRVSGVSETLPPARLMEDALKFHTGSLTRHSITVRREVEPVPAVTVDKHAVLQILINLINNAKYACNENDDEKIVTLRLFKHGETKLCFQVEDNGMGISPENMSRIFQHGFTTRKSGHGFGLHSGALAARQLGGSLSVHSDGPGQGAIFTLELPIGTGDTNEFD